MPNRFSKAQWIAYYSKKRIEQQWMQLHLLGLTRSEKVLEVGPGLGLITALLVTMGYEVVTLDRVPRAFAYPAVTHLEKDICDLRGEEISGHDAILCCETLEHIPWEEVGSVLSAFRHSGAKYLVVSVPYMGFQLAFDVLSQPNHLPTVFLDEEAAVPEELLRRAGRRTPMGGRLPRLSTGRLGKAVNRLRLDDYGAGIHGTLPFGVPPAAAGALD